MMCSTRSYFSSVLALGVLAQSLACTSSRPPAVHREVLSPTPGITTPPSKWTARQQALHVLSRLAYGPSPADLEAVQQMGAAAWIDRQLHPDWIPDDAVTAKLRQFSTLALSTAELYGRYPPIQVQAKLAGLNPANSDDRETILQAIPKEELPRQIPIELTGAKLVRAVESKRQLQEVLVDFWFNHFNVSIDKGQVKWMATSYERDAIRPHLFGTFRELLGATAHHPAMLFYLDNWLSTREDLPENGRKGGEPKKPAGGPRGLNENYARELLELHTMGVNGGYTQKDVREVARCFTGWSIDMPKYIGDFVYRDRAHDKGAKVVLGVFIPPGGGQEDGERVLDLVASHPSTARFIATKLIRKFVSDDPPPALVEAVAGVFLKSGGHLQSVYAAIFSSKEFWADQAFGSKTKTPLEFAVSAVRALGGTTNGDIALAQALDQMGEPLYRSQPPTGFPETAEAWVNAGGLVNRINFGIALATNRLRGTKVDVSRQVTAVAPGNLDALLDSLSLAILGRAPAASTRNTLRQALTEVAGEGAHGQRRPPDPPMIAGLLLGSPEFQKQ
jgi:uncharacterized protein (DUF1800 family)